MISLIELQAREAASEEVKQALRAAATRIRIQSQTHRHLDVDTTGTVDAQDYVAEVCRLIEASLAGVRPIKVHCQAQRTPLGAQKALAIGLVANELITNAVKYAFADGEPGTISVYLDRLPNGYVQLRVTDDGRGCPDEDDAGDGDEADQGLHPRAQRHVRAPPAGERLRERGDVRAATGVSVRRIEALTPSARLSACGRASSAPRQPPTSAP